MTASLQNWERAQRAGELLEAAALGPDGLNTAFESVVSLLDGEMFQLFNFTRPEAPDMIVSPDRTQIYDDYIRNAWHEHDTWSLRAGKVARHGRILTDDTVISLEERKRDPFYQEFCTRWNIGSFTAWTFNLSGEKWAYTLMGRRGSESTAIDTVVYRRFIEAADRAALLAAAKGDLRAQGLAEGLELGGRPTMVLDHGGRVSFATGGAEALVGQGFTILQGRLHSENHATDFCFRQLVLRAQSSRPGHPRNFLIVRSDGRRPILAMPVHLRDHSLHGLPGARILLMLTDLNEAKKPSAAALRSAFHLSSREAQLAGWLSVGDTPEEAAAKMQISVHTVRQMLKTVFAKTDTNRQAELVGLLGRVLSSTSDGPS